MTPREAIKSGIATWHREHKIDFEPQDLKDLIAILSLKRSIIGKYLGVNINKYLSQVTTNTTIDPRVLWKKPDTISTILAKYNLVTPITPRSWEFKMNVIGKELFYCIYHALSRL